MTGRDSATGGPDPMLPSSLRPDEHGAQTWGRGEARQPVWGRRRQVAPRKEAPACAERDGPLGSARWDWLPV